MATLTLPKGGTAILIMDCQNDIVHENGKMAAMSGGAMAKLIKERNVLPTIARVAAAGRTAKIPIIHVRHAYRPDYLDAPQNTPITRVDEDQRDSEGRHLGRGNSSGPCT